MADIQAAGAILYSDDGKDLRYLLLRSARHQEWGPPKGHADADETELETAAREIFEETGLRKLRFTPGFREALTYTVERKGKQRGKEVVLFLAELTHGGEDIRLSEEHCDHYLATISEMERMIPHEDIKQIYRKADAFLRERSK